MDSSYQVLKNKLDQYFNNTLKRYARYPESYGFLVTEGAILATSNQSNAQLIEKIKQDNNFTKMLEQALLRMPYPFKVSEYKIIPLDSSHFLIYPFLSDGSTNEYTLKVFLIKWYLHEGDQTNKVIQLIKSTDLKNQDKLDLLFSNYDDVVSKEILKQGVSNDDILYKYTRDGILRLPPYDYIIPLILENARDPREEQEDALYIYSRSENPEFMRELLPDKLDLRAKGADTLALTLENLAFRELEDEFIYFLIKYSEYIEDDDILRLYRFVIKNKLAVLRVIAALASSKAVREWYEVEEVFDIFGK